MNSTPSLFKLVGTGAAMVLAAASVQADTITNKAINPTGGTTWNGAAYWNSDPDPVVSTNDYEVSTLAASGTDVFSVAVGGTTTTWTRFAFVRDYGTAAPPVGNSTFDGNKLILTNTTAFRGYGRDGNISTANWELQSGSFMYLQPNSAGTGGGTWEGTITTSGTTAIAVLTNTVATYLTINASLSGSGTVNLVASGTNFSSLSLDGNISLFTGTLFVSGSTTATTTPDATRTFSIANSASSATLQLNWESPSFRYDLESNEVSFASLVLTNGEGVDTVLGNGVYDADALNGLTGNAGIFSGAGTITVVPEPSTYALGALGLLVVAFAVRRSILTA